MMCLQWSTKRSSFSRRKLAENGFSRECDFQSPRKPAGLGRQWFSVDATGVLLRTEGLSESSIKWSGYLRVARTVKGFLFYQNEQVYNWLPHHALASDRDEDEVASLASQHAVEYLDWV